MEAFSDLLSSLNSADNVSRSRAERMYNDAMNSNPGLLVNLLGTALSDVNENIGSRSLACVLLRQLICSEKWTMISGTQHLSIQKLLVHTLEVECDQKICKRVVFAIVAFPELSTMTDIIPWILSSVYRATNEKQVVLLFLMNKIIDFAFPVVEKHLNQVVIFLSELVEKASMVDIQVAAGECICSMMLSSTEPNKLKPFFNVPMIMQGIIVALESKSSPYAYDQACRNLELLSDLVSKCIWGFDPALLDICFKLLLVANSEELEEGSRCLGLRLFAELFRKRSKILIQDQKVMERLMNLFVSLQMEESDWQAEWCDEYQPIDDDMLMLMTSGVRSSIVHVFVQVGNSVGQKERSAFLDQILNGVWPLLQSGSPWTSKCAVLTLIAAAAQSSLGKYLKPKMSSIMERIQNLLGDPQPRTRYFAMACVFELLSSPETMTCFNSENAPVGCFVLNILVQLLGPSKLPSLQSAVCICLCRILDPEVCPVTSLEDGDISILLEHLVSYLSFGEPSVKELALLTLGKVAILAGDNFGSYYCAITSGVKSILLNTSNTSGIQAGAMNCIAAIAEAVGPQVFLQDADEVMALLLKQDDENLAIFDFCRRICAVLETQFLKYLPHVLPMIYRAINMELGLMVENVADRDQVCTGVSSDGSITMVQDVRGAGTYKVSANVLAFQARVLALEALDGIVDSLGASFAPFLGPAVEKIIPSIAERIHVLAGIKASEAGASLLHCACLAEQGKSMQDVQRLLVALCVPVLTGLQRASSGKEDTDVDVRAGYASSFERCMRICWFSGGDENEDGSRPKPTLVPPPQLVGNMVSILKESVELSVQRRMVFADELCSQGYSEEDIDELQQEIVEDEASLCSDIVDSIGYLIKMYGPEFLTIFDSELHPLLSALIDPSQSPELRQNAVCLYDDVLEYCGAAKYLLTVFPIMFDCALADHALLRQASIYGIGVIAANWPDFFKNHALATTELLVEIVSDTEDCIDVTENAVSVLGKICDIYRNCVPIDKIIPVWLVSTSNLFTIVFKANLFSS